jgi:hypothetical protein
MRIAYPAVFAALALAACQGQGGPAAKRSDAPKAAASQANAAAIVESEYGTPVKDRVATLGLLNKRNNVSQDVTMKVGESRRFGNIIIKLASCERSKPWELPVQTGAFVQVLVEERTAADQPLRWNKVFSGWLFKETPSLNAVEHPVYDVWVKDCAMRFPGEEDSPAPAASASSAANPAGNAAPVSASARPPAPKAAPAPSASAATPAPQPSPAARPSLDL